MKVLLNRIAAASGVLLIVAGCSSSQNAPAETPNFPVSQQDRQKYGAGGFEGRSSLKDLIFSERADNGDGLPVNKYLWRASLDTLSFLPLSSTDPFSGVIATEWGASPDAPNERVRVTAYVEGKELTARALDVSVFRETLSPTGAWVSATVNPQTAEQVKDKILLRARELRIQDVDGPKV